MWSINCGCCLIPLSLQERQNRVLYHSAYFNPFTEVLHFSEGWWLHILHNPNWHNSRLLMTKESGHFHLPAKVNGSQQLLVQGSEEFSWLMPFGPTVQLTWKRVIAPEFMSILSTCNINVFPQRVQQEKKMRKNKSLSNSWINWGVMELSREGHLTHHRTIKWKQIQLLLLEHQGFGCSTETASSSNLTWNSSLQIYQLSLQHSSSQWRPSFQSPMPGSSCSQLRPLSLLHPISYKSPSHHYLTSLEFFHFPLSLLLYLGQTLSSHPDHNYSFLISSLPLHLSFQFISYTASLVSFLNYRFQQSILSSKFYCSSPKIFLIESKLWGTA